MSTWKVAFVSAFVGAVVSVAATALAGTGVNGIFNLGADNTVNKTSTLRNTSAFTGPQLQVENTAGGPALDLQVNSGKAPLTVNSATRVSKLNADQLDGIDSGAFARSGAPQWHLITGTTVGPNPVPGVFLCDALVSTACWASYGYSSVAYAKDASGFVHLRGSRTARRAGTRAVKSRTWTTSSSCFRAATGPPSAASSPLRATARTTTPPRSRPASTFGRMEPSSSSRGIRPLGSRWKASPSRRRTEAVALE